MTDAPDPRGQMRERVRRIADTADLGGVIGRHVALKRKGKEWAGLCPFHGEKSPSFYVNERKGFFHCFGCGAHGDALAFVMRLKRLPFVEAVEDLERELGIAAGAPVRVRRKPQPVARPARPREERPYWRVWYDDAAPATRNGRIARYLRARAIEDREIGLVLPILRGATLLHREVRVWLPAMLAPLVDGKGRMVGLHATWLHASEPRKADVDPNKQMHGSARGAAIMITAWRPHTVACEGIETALSFAAFARRGLIEGCPRDCGLVAAGSLGNWHGLELPPRRRDPHPTRCDAKGAPLLLPSVQPLLTPEAEGSALLPPLGRTSSFGWGVDSDGRDPPSARRLVARGRNRVRAHGLEAPLYPAPPTMDWNDAKRICAGVERLAKVAA